MKKWSRIMYEIFIMYAEHPEENMVFIEPQVI